VGLSGVPESAATCSAIVRALARHRQLRIRLAGCAPAEHEGPAGTRLRACLEAASERSGVRDRLELLPALGRHEVIGLVDGSVGVLVTRQTPTNGLAALIAMHRGRAVIGVRSRTVDDIVVDSVTGRCVQPGDVRGLLEAIDELLEGDYFPLAWGMAGHERVTSRYATSQLVGRLVRAYAPRPRPPAPRAPLLTDPATQGCGEAIPG
jgi:glycosyltransferase involved in cell wall biosynthesis